MKRRIIHWLRAVFPHWSLVIAVIFFVQTWVFIESAWHGKDPLQRTASDNIGPLLAFGCSLFYAAYRVFAFHPVWNKEYLDWLSATHWTGRKRLPMGPVHLIPQDVVLLSFLLGWVWWWGQSMGNSLTMFMGALLAAFLGVYLLLLAATLRICDEWRGAYAVWFGMGGCAWSYGNWWLFWSLALLTYLCGLAGLKASWRGFPWSAEKLHRSLKMFVEASKGQTVLPTIAQETLGWPFDWLSPKPERVAFTSRQDVVFGSLLFGWWYNCLAVHAVGRPNQVVIQSFLAAPFMIVLFVSGAARISQYVEGLSGQLSLTGRLVTGRWIVPRWDVVFVPTWLLLILNSGLFSLGLNDAAIQRLLPWWDFRLAASAVLAFGMWTQLGNAPPFRKWRLTGSFRMNPDSLTVKQKKSQCVQCN